MGPSPQLPAQNHLEPVFPADSTPAAPRLGESYKIYHAQDTLGSVSDEYELILERAARWCGVDDKTIYAVVERFERRFLRWKKKRDKLEKDPVETESGGEEGVE